MYTVLQYFTIFRNLLYMYIGSHGIFHEGVQHMFA